MAIPQEKQILKLFKSATDKLFKCRIYDAYIDFNRITSLYPKTHLCLKSEFFICMIFLTELYAQCIFTEHFNYGIKAIAVNPIVDLFNKDRYYFLKGYEYYSNKRMTAFNNFQKALSNLIEDDNFAVIKTFVNIAPGKLKDCKPLDRLALLEKGQQFTNEELQKIFDELQYYLLVTIISDNFDIEYQDQLSTISKHKLNRVDFYHFCLTWLNKFYGVNQQYQTGDLIRKCCRIIMGLTNDSADRRRREAFGIMTKMYPNYFTMKENSQPIKEIELYDPEEELLGDSEDVKAFAYANKSSLITLVCFDETNESSSELYKPENYRLAIEINLEPSPEILMAKEELMDKYEDLLNVPQEDSSLKIEFD